MRAVYTVYHSRVYILSQKNERNQIDPIFHQQYIPIVFDKRVQFWLENVFFKLTDPFSTIPLLAFVLA